ncbi:MAG: hypothetical protein VX733_15290 [Candidatus Latescibacterota bacterium]|nr:hypothetical protein [Candidatus Latescibacterota bacterium]
MRKKKLTLLIGLIVAGLLSADAHAQTFQWNRQFMNLGSPEGYLNYGRKEYEPYPQIINSRNRYDRLGNYLLRGFDVFEWELSRPGRSTVTTRTAQYLGWFSNLIILNDSYRGWNYGVTLGEDIRSKFTDLTFNQPRYFGIRLDGSSSDNQFTILLSQGGSLATQQATSKFSTFQSTAERSSVLIFGGRWQTNLGSVLKVGATYFNQHMTDTYNEDGSFFRGDTPYSMLQPSFIEVAVEDDSPDTRGTPAVVYDMDVVIVGESQGQRVRLTSIEGDADFDPTIGITRSGGTPTADGGWQVAGAVGRVVYEFQMPDVVLSDPGEYALDPDIPSAGLTVKSVRFVARVSGDYRIGVRQQHLWFDSGLYDKNLEKVADGNDKYLPGGSSYRNPYTGLKGDEALLTPMEAREQGLDAFRRWPVAPDPQNRVINPFIDYKWDRDVDDIFYTVARSEARSGEGNVVKTVSFDYGIPTAQSLYGLDWELTLKDTKIRGEFTTNPQHFIYPVGSNAGRRHDKRAWAYFVTASREIGSVQIGGEVFKMDPDYSGNYDSIRGGVPFFSDNCVTCPKMQEMFVMTDNDDNDQWPDELSVERPSAEKQDSGIFPGLDENQDLVPDTDQNVNAQPDWLEPVVFYDADPPEFVYGIDFNNNGVVDFRENDHLPDYPYRRDRQGFHAFAIKDGLGRLGRWFSLGGYQIKEQAGGGRASAIYARYEHNIVSPYFGRLRIHEDVKFVKDDIRDDVYVWRDLSTNRIPSPYPELTGNQIEERDLNSQLFPPEADPLLMRNSLVNTLSLQSRFSPAIDVNLVNNFQWVRNSRSADDFKDGTSQDDDLRSLHTVVNKVDYTIRAGDLNIKPMFKHLTLREHSSELDDVTGKGSIRSFTIFTPILRTRYNLTQRSNLQLAFQGFPFWKYRKLDHVDETQDFKEWTIIFMMSNRSDHYGYNLASQFGWMKTSRTHDDESLQALDMDNSRLFFDVIAGF